MGVQEKLEDSKLLLKRAIGPIKASLLAMRRLGNGFLTTALF